MWLSSRSTWSRCWAMLHFEECSSRFSWRQQPDFLRLDSERASQSTTGPWNLMLQHTERLAAIGSLLMFFLLLICSNNFVCLFNAFQKKILLSRPRRKRICVGFLALSIFVINIKVALIELKIYDDLVQLQREVETNFQQEGSSPWNSRERLCAQKRYYLSNRTPRASGRLAMKAHVRWILQLWMVANLHVQWKPMQSRNTLSKIKSSISRKSEKAT